jgi:hypothetical protein
VSTPGFAWASFPESPEFQPRFPADPSRIPGKLSSDAFLEFLFSHLFLLNPRMNMTFYKKYRIL